jgi:CHASE2 domain-containing sensor protein
MGYTWSSLTWRCSLRHFLFLTFLLTAFATPAFAQDGPAPAETAEEVAPAEATPEAPTPDEVEEVVEDATELVETAVDAALSQSWPMLIGIVLIAVVAVLRKVGIEGKLPKGSKSLPWVTLGLAAAASVGAALLGQMEWSAVLMSTLLAAGTAMGGWDLTKLFRPKEKAILDAPAE